MSEIDYNPAKSKSPIRDFLRSALRRFANRFSDTGNVQKPRSFLHEYWKQPWDSMNSAEYYTNGIERSTFLVSLIERYAYRDSSILEIGCNVGRNLQHLWTAGYAKLAGIEISERAIELMKQTYPEMAKQASIWNSPVENAILAIQEDAFDMTFTMAVLEHIHLESDFVFKEIARITKRFIITIEDERGLSWRHFPRNYRKVFEKLGFREIEKLNCRGIPGLGRDFAARVLEKS